MGLYPESPTPISYSAGLADMSPLGNLATDFFQGAENKRKYDVARTFKDGLPRAIPGDPNSPIDFNRAAEMLATRGDASQLVPLANVDLQRKLISAVGDDTNRAFPTGQPSPQSAAPQATPSGSFADRTASVESGDNPAAKNPNSSASGLYQFTNATWIENFDKTFPQAAAGLTPQQKLAVRDNPQLRGLQDKVFQTFTAGNEAALKNGEVPVNDTTRYAAHFFGAAGAQRILTAPAATPLASLISPEAIAANPTLRGMTAGQARNWLAQKMPSGDGQQPAALDRPAAPSQAAAYAPPERPAIPPHGIPQGSADGSPPAAGPVRVAGPAMAAASSPSAAPGPATAQPSPPATAQPQAGAQPQAAPQASAPMPAELRAVIPPQYNDPLQFVNVLRTLQSKYDAVALSGAPGASGAATAAKSFGAQADKVMDIIGKYYERTSEQKNATASGGLNPLQFEGAKQRSGAEAKNLEITPEAKNFMFDRRPGESMAEFEARVAGGKKYAEDEASRFGKKYDAISKAGQEASVELPQLQLAKSILNDPKFYSGPAEGLNLGYKRILATIDPSQADAAQPQEAFRKVVSNSILSQIRSLAGTGQIRVAEIRIMEKAAANQENTPAANRLLVDIATRLHQHALGLDDLARNYNGGRLDPGFDTKARQWTEQHPLFTPAELKDPRLIAPPIFSTPEEVKKAGLGKGAPFQTPDGRIKYVP